MAKSKFDTSFDFGANAKKSTGSKKKGGKRKSAAQQATAALYLKPRRR
jgi:hypothetical protein